MKPSELRIGNYISDKFASDSFYAKVKKLNYRRCYYGGYHSSYSNLKPIFLTEEWLIKFGFKSQIGFWIMTKGKFGEDGSRSLELGRNDKDLIYAFFRNFNFNEADDFVLLRSDVKYVHELQNLYFSLTGKELELIQNENQP